MKKLVLNNENPNGVYIDLTAEEITQREQDTIQSEAEKVAREQEEANAITKKASGKQKLLDLGLSEEEVKALIGV